MIKRPWVQCLLRSIFGWNYFALSIYSFVGNVEKLCKENSILVFFADSSVNFKRLVCAWYCEDQEPTSSGDDDTTQNTTDGDTTTDDVTPKPTDNSVTEVACLPATLIVVTVGVTLLFL